MSSPKYWQLEMSKAADKVFSKLDKPVKQRILNFLIERVIPSGNPRLFGKSLTGKLAGYWSYRIGDYRVLADIQDNRLVIIVVDIDHRRQVYDE